MKKYFLFGILSIILTTIWFHKGLLIGLGESGVSFYNVKNQLAITSHTWSPFALGIFPGLTICTLPLFYFANLLSQIGISDVGTQAIIFGLCLFSSFIGTTLLTNYLFVKSKNKEVISIFTGLFYGLNLVSLVTAWNRLQYPFLFFYIVIPFALYTFIKACDQKKYAYAILLNVIFLVFSSAFAAIPFIELIWGLLLAYSFFIVLVNWKKDPSKALFAILFYILSVTIWALFNSWWLLQMIKAIESVLGENVYSIKGDIGTLNILSQEQGNLSFVYRLMNQQFFDSMKTVWGNFYNTPPFIVISYIIPFLAFSPLIIKKKPGFIYFFLGLSLLVIYFIKGSNPPFGGIYLFLFSHLKIFEVFCSSFEKYGLVLPLAYAPLIGFTLLLLFTTLKNSISVRKTYFIFTSLGLLLFVVLVYPFWNNLIFTYNLPPENNPSIGDYVSVPIDYQSANTFLHKDTDIYRGMALPIDGEGMTYEWKYGFNGVEYLNDMFGIPFLSLGTSTIPNLQNITDQFNYTLFKYPFSFTKMMTLLNVKYLLVRSDIDYKNRNTTNPHILTDYINGRSIANLSFEKQFGKLAFYKNMSFIPKIYTAKNLFAAPQSLYFTDIFTLNNFQNKDVVVNTNENEFGDKLAQSALSETILPKNVINSDQVPKITLTQAELQIPMSRYGADSRFFPLIRFKENLSRWGIVDSQDKLLYDINISYKRLGELQRIALANNLVGIGPAENEYISSLGIIEKTINSQDSATLSENIDSIRAQFLAEQVILNNLINSLHPGGIRSSLQSTRSVFTEFEKHIYVISLYPSQIKNSIQSENIYRFMAPLDGNYQVLLRQLNYQQYYKTQNQVTIQINNKIIIVTPTYKNGFISYGTFMLDKGLNEFHILTPITLNLIKENSSLPLTLIATSQKTEIRKTFHLKNFDPYSQYVASFDYKITNGGGATIEAESDVDAVKDGKNVPEWSQGISGSVGNFNWQHVAYRVYPYHTATTQSISFVVNATNSCIADNQQDMRLVKMCSTNKSFYTKYTHNTEFIFKNVKLEKIFPSDLMLFKQNMKTTVIKNPTITFNEINGSTYIVHIKNAINPYNLVFSENFNPDWQVIYNNAQIATSKHFMVNSFANAWQIDKTGTYNITVRFQDENLFLFGKVLSLLSIICSVSIFTVYKIWKKKKT